MEFKPATEPTNIVWENRFVPQHKKIISTIKFVILVTLLLFCTFAITFKVDARSDDYELKYSQMDCATIQTTYNDNQILKHAMDTWNDYYHEN